MSSTVATVASSNGCQGSSRNAVWIGSTVWVFAYTGTQTLASYWSTDGVNWYAGATFTMSFAHDSEGRNLCCAYRHIGSVDAVHLGWAWKLTTNLGLSAVRATCAANTLTFHLTETTVDLQSVDSGALYYAGNSLEVLSNAKAILSSGWGGVSGQGNVNADVSSVDAGTAEQMVPVTYTDYTPDSGSVNQSRSAYVADTGSGTALLIADDGSGTSSTTGLSSYTWNGSAWSGSSLNRAVTGSISAIDKNDWGAVALATNDVHVVYRAAGGGFVHRRWNGTSWGAGSFIPALSTASGTGVALAQDGTSVYLVVIANDAANTVSLLEWHPATGWDLAWTQVETSTATRTFISCTRDLQAGLLPIFWHEGTTLKCSLYNTLADVLYYYFPYWFNAMRVM